MSPLNNQIHRAAWRLHLCQRGDTISETVKATIKATQRVLNTVVGPKKIDRQWKVTTLDILKENCPATKMCHIGVKLMSGLASVRRHSR